MTKYADIIARLEKADGPSNEIDWLITQAVSPGAVWQSSDHETFTASLDAAIALVERKLPGCSWNIEKLGGRDHTDDMVGFNAFIHDDKGEFGNFCSIPDCEPPFCKTAAIALLLALFRSLSAQGGK